MNERERERETRREATARQDFSCHNSLPFSKDFEPRLPSYYYSLLLLLPLQHIYIFRHFIFFSSPFSFHLSPHRPTSPEGGAPTVLRQSGPFELHADHVYKIKWGNTVILGSANYRLNANECLNPRSQPGVCVAFDDVIRPLYPHPLWLIHRRRSDCATKSSTSSRSHFSAWTTIKMNRGKKKDLTISRELEEKWPVMTVTGLAGEKKKNQHWRLEELAGPRNPFLPRSISSVNKSAVTAHALALFSATHNTRDWDGIVR